MQKITTLVISFLFAASVLSSFAQTSAQPLSNAAADSISAESLLRRAHAMLPSLAPADRADLLRQLVNAGSRKHPREAAIWMEEGFRLAPQVTNRWVRITCQIGLISSLTYMNSQEALDKLATIEPPTKRGADAP